MPEETVFILLFIVATAVAIAVQRLSIPYTVALVLAGLGLGLVQMIEITLTTIAAYGSFLAAEHFHYSGVIATVSAGLLCGNYGARIGMSPSTRVAVETFWEYMAFALNSMSKGAAYGF